MKWLLIAHKISFLLFSKILLKPTKYWYLCFFWDLDLLTFSSNWSFRELERAPEIGRAGVNVSKGSEELAHAAPEAKSSPEGSMLQMYPPPSPPGCAGEGFRVGQSLRLS